MTMRSRIPEYRAPEAPRAGAPSRFATAPGRGIRRTIARSRGAAKGMQVAALLLLACAAGPGRADVGPVVEYFHEGFGHYFITAFPEEAAALDAGAIAGWKRTGLGFSAELAPASSLQPVCRFFSTSFAPKSSHFYTPSPAECAKVRGNPDWQFEAIAFHAALPLADGNCASGAKPVIRLYNDGRSGAPNHRYTTSASTRDTMLAQGWIAEGAVFCSPDRTPPVDPIAYGGNFPAATTEFTRATLAIRGEPRDSWVYRPAGGDALPVLLLLTGTGGTVEWSLLDELGRGTVQDWADQQRVIVVAPLPRTMTRGDWDNHTSGTPYWETAIAEGTASPASADPDVNPDLLFVRALVRESQRAYGADAQRVHALGFSNGAFFAYFVAATLNDRIAAFAATGGGLVLSNTTHGEPAACEPAANPAAPGAVRSCTAAGWTPGTCRAAGAVARPIAPASVARVPPAFLEANDDDTSVPYAHTCNLAAALPTTGDHVARIVHGGGGHVVNAGFIDSAWTFMQGRRLSAR